MLRRYQVHAHLRCAMYLFLARTCETKFCHLLYVGERLFNGLTLTVAADESRVDCYEETVFILLDDDWKPAREVSFFHYTQI